MPSYGLSASVFADVGGLVTEVHTLAFVVSTCIPSLHRRARAIAQPFVIYHVESGLSWVRLFQRYRTDAVTVVADTLCHTVSVPFYGVSLPIIMWMNPYLGTHMTLLMAITQYIGNAMKDLVSAPRPSSLKYAEVRIAQTRTMVVNEREKELNAAEYGFPSSHAMNSLAYNFYLAAALHKHGAVSDGAASYWYGVVMVFVCTVALSRVYLGLHTPIDILGGAVAGLAVVTAYSRLQWAWGVLDVFLYEGRVSWRLAATGLSCLLLLRLHPTPESHTPSYGTCCSERGCLCLGLLRSRRDLYRIPMAHLLSFQYHTAEFSTSFVGVAFGVICGVQVRRTWFPDQVYGRFGFVIAPGNVFSATLLLRLIAGLAMLGVTKLMTKWMFSRLLPLVYTYFPIRIRRLWQPPIVDTQGGATSRGIKQTLDGRDADIDATTRFASYAALGFAANLGVIYW